MSAGPKTLHPEPIVIVGMQRSGTSALAGALSRLGVSFGSQAMLYESDSNNPMGYFEHRKATVLNLRCLDAFCMHPISFGALPPDWETHPESNGLKSELQSFVRDEFGGQGRWAIKQPLTSLVLPLYLAVFRHLGLRPHFVMCVRHPLETMASEARLSFEGAYRVMPSLGETAIGSWLRYTLGPFADLAGERLTVVPYDKLISEPEKMLGQVIGNHDGWTPSDLQRSEAVGSIRIDLRHNRLSASDLDTFPAIVRRTYSAVLAYSDGKTDRTAELLQLERDFRTWVDMLAAPPVPARKLGLAWIDQAGQKVAEIRYQPSGTWQTVRLSVDAPPKTPVSGILYPFPSRIWIRRIVWRRQGATVPAELRVGPASFLSRSGQYLKLDAAYEPNQIMLTTPGGQGPYELEIELWLQTSPTIETDIAARLGKALDECTRK